jgi:hypothetical protein
MMMTLTLINFSLWYGFNCMDMFPPKIINHHWSSENPHLMHEVPLHDIKAGVWCAISIIYREA